MFKHAKNHHEYHRHMMKRPLVWTSVILLVFVVIAFPLQVINGDIAAFLIVLSFLALFATKHHVLRFMEDK